MSGIGVTTWFHAGSSGITNPVVPIVPRGYFTFIFLSQFSIILMWQKFSNNNWILGVIFIIFSLCLCCKKMAKTNNTVFVYLVRDNFHFNFFYIQFQDASVILLQKLNFKSSIL